MLMAAGKRPETILAQEDDPAPLTQNIFASSDEQHECVDLFHFIPFIM